ncbi:3-hydroxyisobutyrate dehydrogenase [Chitinimonas sp. BJB300]|uniref:3-hydroxyisobutyrate dehydrogenase n=1 Tax=Chitinimonas sp. BJB300 TaxID=1559339 RepID=UPI000C1154E4|nr:3-hydroxyisobutyrate dehydrogenase [Chitinimonas sp. BJB300]PHV10557.1 3-hydroxyisobutyrate dehydrogenase [Chitinimonas sp. BJB300]TSJ87067.1 3-hydroxyisobutyrate dehydrogenase [Chitinimonas sp. BJB300]
MPDITFIGLGHMGAPMAANLLKADFPLKVFDLAPAAMQTAVQLGAMPTPNALHAVMNADIVISMLPASQHVEGLYLGEGRLIHAISPGAIVLECSTISPEVARKVHAAAKARGIHMLDAPVSGGTAGAAAGTLTFIVGGEASDLATARPILEKMGKNVFHAGGPGAGQVAKIANNMLLAIHMIGTAEALNLGVANGLDPKVLSDIMRVSSGGNWSLEKYNPWPGVMNDVPASRDYQGGFGVDLMLKDLGLAMEAALATRTSTPLGAAARSLYALHSNQGKGTFDFSSIQQLFKRPNQDWV